MVQYAWETINTAIAFSNSLYLIYSNRSGNENNLAFWGGSHVIDYTGKMIRKAKIFSSDLVYVQLDLAALESAQSEFSRTSEEKNEITVKQLSQEENLIS
jgi:predicted amidohydrolase